MRDYPEPLRFYTQETKAQVNTRKRAKELSVGDQLAVFLNRHRSALDRTEADIKDLDSQEEEDTDADAEEAENEDEGRDNKP